MEEKSVQIFKPYKRTFSRVIMVGGNDAFYLKILDQPSPIGMKLPILKRYLLVASQLQRLVKKVQLTLIGSPQCTFQ